MRYSKIQEAHIERREVPSREVCDLCGRDTDHADHVYHEEEVTISAFIGDVYPEGSQQTAYDVDICGDCFVTMVVPALMAIGIVVRRRRFAAADRVPDPERGEVAP